MQIPFSIRHTEHKGRRLIAGRQSPIRLTLLDGTVFPSRVLSCLDPARFPMAGHARRSVRSPKPVLSSPRVTSHIIPLVGKFRLTNEEQLQ